LAANASNDVKIDYIKKLFIQATRTDGTDVINCNYAQPFLEYRAGGICAEFNDENKSRADALNNAANVSSDPRAWYWY